MTAKYGFRVVVDVYEKRPFGLAWGDFAGVERAALSVGDYSIVGLEGEFAIERKSVDDLANCVDCDRERFQDQVRRLACLLCGVVVIEGDVGDVLARRYHSGVHPHSVLGTAMGWQVTYGVPFLFAGKGAGAVKITTALLANYWRRHLRESLRAVPVESAACA